MVPVGAMCVGKIGHTYSPENLHKKGDEFGYFAFGGSSLVLLFEKNKIVLEQVFVTHSQEHIETAVIVGQKLAKLRS